MWNSFLSWLSFRINEASFCWSCAQVEHYHRCNIFRSQKKKKIPPAIKSKRRGLLSTGVVLLNPILPVQQLKLLRTCIAGIFHVRSFCQISLWVISTCPWPLQEAMGGRDATDSAWMVCTRSKDFLKYMHESMQYISAGWRIEYKGDYVEK